MVRNVKFSVVIPTRNREVPLKNLLRKILTQTVLPNEVIIVDSSDNIHASYSEINKMIRYFHTNEKSAAGQRNLGMANVEKDTKVLFFLDDDTNPDTEYFEKMLNTLMSNNAIGVSGLAMNPKKTRRVKPSGIRGFIKRITFLDSKTDGKLLISGVAIPVRDKESVIMETDWLIGCSCWNFQKIKWLKFEEDFAGYSLGEDVIFSIQAKKFGKLLVNTDIQIDHFELPHVETNIVQFNSMWVYNRFRIRKYLDRRSTFYFAFFFSTFARTIYTLMSLPKKPYTGAKQILGITLGLVQIVKDSFKT
jgi:glycosyltransferase involved in cell wall biosynthesis